MPDESFYTLHDDFEPTATSWVRWRVCASLVRSIEGWCSQIYQIEPIDSQLLTNRAKVQQHFDRWYLQVQVARQLNRSTLLESWCEHLLDRLRLHPEDPTIRLHWIAFLMHRCVAVGWKIWRLIPPEYRSFPLFQEIISASHYHLGKFNQTNPILGNFQSNKSQLVSGIDHVKAYIDRQIKYSLLPDLRKLLGDPNFGRTNLGAAAHHSLTIIRQALEYSQLPDRHEYIILWQCFNIYRQETGIHVNRLVESDFQEIGENYLIRSASSMNLQPNLDVKHKLEEIGKAVRDSMLTRSISLDAEINESQSLGDIIPDVKTDLIEAKSNEEKWTQIEREVRNICNTSSNVNPKIPSHAQIFWLYYGLKLKQTQIGKILQENFQINPNPGTVAHLLQHRRQNLFNNIHLALENPPPSLTNIEIATTMGELLDRYFDRLIDRTVIMLAGKLDVQIQTQLSIDCQEQLINCLTSWCLENIELRIDKNILHTAIFKLIDRYFTLLDRQPQ